MPLLFWQGIGKWKAMDSLFFRGSPANSLLPSLKIFSFLCLERSCTWFITAVGFKLHFFLIPHTHFFFFLEKIWHSIGFRSTTIHRNMPRKLWLLCSLPGSSVHRISQARILVWVAMPSTRRPSDPWIEPTSPAAPALQADSLPLVKNSPAKAGDVRDSQLIPGLWRSLGGGHGNSL